MFHLGQTKCLELPEGSLQKPGTAKVVLEYVALPKYRKAMASVPKRPGTGEKYLN